MSSYLREDINEDVMYGPVEDTPIGVISISPKDLDSEDPDQARHLFRETLTKQWQLRLGADGVPFLRVVEQPEIV